MFVCLFLQKIVALKLQLTRFEEGNVYHFEWPVKSSVVSDADQVHRHSDISQCCSTEGVSGNGATERQSNHLPAGVAEQSDRLTDGSRAVHTGNSTGHAPHPITETRSVDMCNNRGNELNRTSTDSEVLAGDTTGPSVRNATMTGHLNSVGAVTSLSVSSDSRPHGPGDKLPHLPPVPTSNQCDSAQTDSGVAELRKAPSEVMSPKSYTVFKSSLVHVPEMNLPWESMRNTTKCECGVTFSYSIRKVCHWASSGQCLPTMGNGWG